MEKRYRLLTVKVEPEKYERWKKRARELNLTLSDMVRSFLDDGKVVVEGKRRIAPVDPVLIRQLASIGNLMNQIARKLNYGEKPDREMADTLKEIEKELKKILAKHKREDSRAS